MPEWRFSLTHIDKVRHKKGFSNLEEVVAYLQQLLTTPEITASGVEKSEDQPISGLH